MDTLSKPGYAEPADISVINENMTKIQNYTNTLGSYIDTEIAKREIFSVSLSNLTALGSTGVRFPNSGTSSQITTNTICIGSYLSNPRAQGGQWTITTYNGYLKATGTFVAGQTANLTLYLVTLM